MGWNVLLLDTNTCEMHTAAVFVLLFPSWFCKWKRVSDIGLNPPPVL